MCMAIPGKITSINKDSATVKIFDKEFTATLIDNNYKVGDYVIIEKGIVSEKVAEKEAIECLDLLRSLEQK